MRNFVNSAICMLLLAVLVSCAGSDDRNYQYMPDMYQEVSYEAYGDYKPFAKGMEAKSPVEGTIPRNWMPYPYEDTNEGYEKSKSLENPVAYTEENVKEGEQLYGIYCAVCHGDKGDGKGTLVEKEKILGVPKYNDKGRNITMGSAYHVMYYGRNTMGSYAVQTSIKERWEIAHHVEDLKRALDGKPEREFVKEAADTQKDKTSETREDTGSVGGETKSSNAKESDGQKSGKK